MNTVINIKNIKKTYIMGTVEVNALVDISVRIDKNEYVAIMGPSGSGKSTLMNILGCLDKPTGGSYVLDGVETSQATSDEFARIRNEKIGFVFQGFNLLSKTTALENVELPLFYRRGRTEENPTILARRALEDVGLRDRLYHTSTQLSGGQQQRVAIARAIVNDPAFILADEPTGNLDTEMSLEIMGIFQALNERGKTVVMVTHEPDVASYSRRTIVLRDGEIVSDNPIHDRKNAADDLAAWKEKHDLLSTSREAVS